MGWYLKKLIQKTMPKYFKIVFKAFIFLDLFLIIYFCVIFFSIVMIQDYEYAKDSFRYIMGAR